MSGNSASSRSRVLAATDQSFSSAWVRPSRYRADWTSRGEAFVPSATSGERSLITSSSFFAWLADLGQVEPGVGGVGAIGAILQEPLEDGVGLGWLPGVNQRPAPLGEHGVEAGGGRVPGLEPGVVLHEQGVRKGGLGRPLQLDQQPGAGQGGEVGGLAPGEPRGGLCVGLQRRGELPGGLARPRASAASGRERVVGLRIDEGGEGDGGFRRLPAVESRQPSPSIARAATAGSAPGVAAACWNCSAAWS